MKQGKVINLWGDCYLATEKENTIDMVNLNEDFEFTISKNVTDREFIDFCNNRQLMYYDKHETVGSVQEKLRFIGVNI